MFNICNECSTYYDANNTPSISLACCPTAEPDCPDLSCFEQIKQANRKKEKEKESTMGYNSANANLVVQAAPANPDAESKSHLLSRVWETYYPKASNLREFYNMDEDHPGHGQAMIDRVLAGKFTVDVSHKGTDDEYSRIIWRDPATPKDEKGYFAAAKRLGDARQKAVDEITVLFPEMGLESLREFEKFDATVEAAPTVH